MNTETANVEGGEAAGPVRVWDLSVRVFHWTVALGFFVAYFSEDLLAVHAWAGYVIGILIVMRIVWGFVGPQHARFSDFVCGPLEAWRYLLGLITFRARRYLGHSPAGGMMVLLLLAGLSATVWSGLEVYAIENRAGPLAALALPIGAAKASEGEGEEHAERRGEARGETLWEEAHETLANLTLALVVLHVAGVVLASLVHHENLVASMFTGFKRRN